MRTWTLTLLLTLAACAAGTPEPTTPLPRSPSGPADFELVSITPDTLDEPGSGAMMRAVLRYRVHDPETFPGPYVVSYMFRTERGGIRMATPEDRAGWEPPRSDDPRGEVVIEYPLDLAVDAPGITHPLTVSFSFGRVLEEADDSPPVTAPDGSLRRAGARVMIARRIDVSFGSR